MANPKRTLSEDIAIKDANRDPITGEPGSHPIGTSIGAASGASAGAVIGSAAGPVGTATGAVVGAIAGGIVGGFAGSGLAEIVNPTYEEAYWRENYASRPYVTAGESFETYKPAYRYGYDARAKNLDSTFDDVRENLRNEWNKNSNNKNLDWNKAEGAVRDAYVRTGEEYTRKIEDNTKI